LFSAKTREKRLTIKGGKADSTKKNKRRRRRVIKVASLKSKSEKGAV